MSDATTTGPDWRALVIQHERPTPPGLIEPWLRDRGAEVEILRIDEEDPHDLNPQDYGLIVSLGSEFGAYEDSIKWISHEIDLLQAATKADVPILGVCFGGHLLARTLGGEVFRSEQEEIGWLPVETQDRRARLRRALVPVALRHVHGSPGSAGSRRRPTSARRRFRSAGASESSFTPR